MRFDGRSARAMDESHPARGAWIEIYSSRYIFSHRQSHPARGAWIEISIMCSLSSACPSHPARGAWIEIFQPTTRGALHESHPARGAWIEIFATAAETSAPCLSHPARGAWIEILLSRFQPRNRHSRTPQGVRGLKLNGDIGRADILVRRTPQGVRGLKCSAPGQSQPDTSHPARGAWIEIRPKIHLERALESHPARGAWIEIW